MYRKRIFALLALVGLLAAPAQAASVEVRLKLPQKARLDLTGRDSIAIAPFLVVSQEGEDRLRSRNIDVQAEFERYLEKVLRRDTDLRVVDAPPTDYPTYDLTQLARERDFWSALGERTQADLILAGGLDFDIQDRTGYRTEEYVSPYNGRRYYRQVLVEQTGFEYDILLHVYDGRTGELLYTDNFKDFQNFEAQSADPLRGMFENLYSLEDRIVGVFAQQEIEATRVLFN
ncbi:MAG TPA: hypothetical protein VHQ65_11390 [Thermoanaerobaculia bacterium]|nr:hypothetical protein [Thermoanaerobaculia bacterium]